MRVRGGRQYQAQPHRPPHPGWSLSPATSFSDLQNWLACWFWGDLEEIDFVPGEPAPLFEQCPAPAGRRPVISNIGHLAHPDHVSINEYNPINPKETIYVKVLQVSLMCHWIIGSFTGCPSGQWVSYWRCLGQCCWHWDLWRASKWSWCSVKQGRRYWQLGLAHLTIKL